MGSKNNPKNRGGAVKTKKYNGKDVEPVMFIDPINKRKYLSAKYVKSTDIICGAEKSPIKWSDISDKE